VHGASHCIKEQSCDGSYCNTNDDCEDGHICSSTTCCGSSMCLVKCALESTSTTTTPPATTETGLVGDEICENVWWNCGDSLVTCGDSGPYGYCLCVQDVHGTQRCIEEQSCDGSYCNTNDDCEDSHICSSTTCCGSSMCLVKCTSGISTTSTTSPSTTSTSTKTTSTSIDGTGAEQNQKNTSKSSVSVWWVATAAAGGALAIILLVFCLINRRNKGPGRKQGEAKIQDLNNNAITPGGDIHETQPGTSEISGEIPPNSMYAQPMYTSPYGQTMQPYGPPVISVQSSPYQQQPYQQQPYQQQPYQQQPYQQQPYQQSVQMQSLPYQQPKQQLQPIEEGRSQLELKPELAPQPQVRPEIFATPGGDTAGRDRDVSFSEGK